MNFQQQVVSDIQKFFQDEIINRPGFELDPDTDIIFGGLIDSMGIIRLMVHVQQLYGIEELDRSDIVLDNFRTINRIATMVSKYSDRAVINAADPIA